MSYPPRKPVPLCARRPHRIARAALIACAAASLAGTAVAANLALTDPASPVGQRGLVYKGRPVFAAGSGSFWLLSDPYYYNADGTTNLARLRAHLDKYKAINPAGNALGVIRLSAWGTPVRYAGVDHSKKRYPCARSATPGARDGGNKFDCSRFDEAFFSHVVTVAREADSRGILLGIILWDEIPLERDPVTHRWNDNPFCPDNNVNGYGLPSCDADGLPEFYDAAPSACRDHQDAIVRKFADVLKDEPNVFFFIGNEYTGSAAWRDRQIQTINERNAANGADLLHVTMEWTEASAISDGVSPGTHDVATGSKAFRADGRPLIAERPTTKAIAGARQQLWQRFIDGAASAGTRDDYNGDTPPDATKDQQASDDQQLRRFVNSLIGGLDRLVPDDGPFSGGWNGRVRPGAEYVAHRLDSSGTITVDLTGENGAWKLLDWDPLGSAGPVDRGTRAAGGSVSWAVRSGECAVQIVPADAGASDPPVIPGNLRIVEDQNAD